MNMKKNLKLLLVVLILGIAFSCMTAYDAAFSQAGDMPRPGPMMGAEGICADQQYLYAVTGGKILQYALSTMTLARSVDLPEPPPPPNISATGSETAASQSGKFPPPPPFLARSQWLLIAGSSLYVMMGPMIYQYSIPNLVLQNSVDLPKPELP